MMHESHWDAIYAARDADELRWHEPVPSTLSLVVANSNPSESVIDVGGGASRLTAELLRLGYDDLTVLDVSAAALERATERLGDRAGSVALVRGDVTAFDPQRQWRVWHDRAVYHFLVEPADRAAYRSAAAAGVAAGGVVVIATFGPDGPSECAGLPVRCYDETSLLAEFVEWFDPVAAAPLEPTPGGDQRPYVAAVVRRRG